MSKKTVQAEHVAELLDYQGRFAQAANKVDELQSLIDAQESIIAEARASIPSLADFSQKREDLLAEIAEGKADAASLKLLDEAIAQRQKEVGEATDAATQSIRNAEQTINGVRKKLGAAEQQFSKLDAHKYDHLMEFITQEAEEVGAEYIHLADQLADKFTRLVGLSAFRNRIGHSRKRSGDDFGFLFRATEIKIPKFYLKVFGLPRDWYDGLLFSISKLDASKLVQVEEESLRELGVDLLQRITTGVRGKHSPLKRYRVTSNLAHDDKICKPGDVVELSPEVAASIPHAVQEIKE
jgi:hypothetical protein